MEKYYYYSYLYRKYKQIISMKTRMNERFNVMIINDDDDDDISFPNISFSISPADLFCTYAHEKRKRHILL